TQVNGGMIHHHVSIPGIYSSTIYDRSLHGALPISAHHHPGSLRHRLLHEPDQAGSVLTGHDPPEVAARRRVRAVHPGDLAGQQRSEEHTSELQSRENLVCRLLLEINNLMVGHK